MGRTIDTLTLFDDLKQSSTEDQAHALSRALKHVEEARLDELATKGDIADLRRDMAEMELRLIKWLVGTGLAVVGALFALFRLMG